MKLYPMCTKIISILTFLALVLSISCELDYSYQIQIGFQHESDRAKVARVTIWILEGEASCFELTSGVKIPQQLTAHARFDPAYPFDAINKINSIPNKMVLIFAEAKDDNGTAILRACTATQPKGSSLRIILELRRICVGDSDSDGICDSLDLCIGNDASGDTDGDAQCDDVDTDDDNDTWSDADESSCGTDPLQLNSVPTDDDLDGVCDLLDLCVGADTTFDTDKDGTCNDQDKDDDGDGWSDAEEIACDADPIQSVSVPLDEDNDGVCDPLDMCTGDDASGDTENDGICDDLDTDDDGDGWFDADEIACGSDPLSSGSIPIDSDSDGVPNCLDECPNDPDKTEVGLCGCAVPEGTCSNQVAAYEAENYTNLNTCGGPATTASGVVFMDYGGGGSWIEWDNVIISKTETVDLVFRYACVYCPRRCDVIVNGTNMGTVAFPSTDEWDIWLTDTISVPLVIGSNTIRLISIGNGPNLDKMTVTPP